MFNNNKLKKIESDILDLQYDVKNLKETINQAEKNIEESKTYKEKCHYKERFNYNIPMFVMEKIVDDKIYIKDVLDKILKELGMVLVYKEGTEAEYSIEKAEKPKKKSKK